MMKRLLKTGNTLLLAAVTLLMVSACNKDATLTDQNTEAISAQAVLVADATVAGDAVYAVNVCQQGEEKDSVSFSSLTASVKTYLSANYPGYTFKKAFKIFAPAHATEGYVVVIQFNEKPVALKFDAGGTFVKILELREARDMKEREEHG